MQELSREPSWQLNHTLKNYIESWVLDGRVPESSMEGIMPDFARVFKKKPGDVTLDVYRHTKKVPGWHFKEMNFGGDFDHPFYFYVPENWSHIVIKDSLANILEDDVIRQTVFLLSLEEWYEVSKNIVQHTPIAAFSYHILYDLPFLRWLFITKDNNKNEFGLFGVYSSGSHVILIKAPARDKIELENQLVSLVNTSPWEDWIQSGVKFKN